MIHIYGSGKLTPKNYKGKIEKQHTFIVYWIVTKSKAEIERE